MPPCSERCRRIACPEWRGTDDYVFATAWGRADPARHGVIAHDRFDQRAQQPGRRREAKRSAAHARRHDLRHIHATTLLLAGVPVHVVAARLGHADPSITLRVYVHVISDQLTEAADILRSRDRGTE